MTHHDYAFRKYGNEIGWKETIINFITVALFILTLVSFSIGNIFYLYHSSRMVEELKAVKAEIVKTRQYAAQAEINSRWCRE